MYSPFFPFFNLVPSFLLVRTYRFETFDYRDGEKLENSNVHASSVMLQQGERREVYVLLGKGGGGMEER